MYSHSFSITRSIPEGDSENIEVLTAVNDTYKSLGCIVHGAEVCRSQSILRNGLDSSFGVRAGTSPRHMIHFCAGVNLGPLKQKRALLLP